MKKCTKCKKTKSLNEFYKDNSRLDKRSIYCKTCIKTKNKLLYKKFNEKRLCEKRFDYIQNKEKILNKQKLDRCSNPEKHILKNIQQRCNNKNNPSYKYYGGRGIKCNITEKEIRQLMDRDGYWNMDNPSIDRIDNDKHYEYGNCRYIEQSENSYKRYIDNKTLKSILQYDKQGNFIKEWKSATEIEKTLGYLHQGIAHCCSGKYKASMGYIWKYNELN